MWIAKLHLQFFIELSLHTKSCERDDTIINWKKSRVMHFLKFELDFKNEFIWRSFWSFSFFLSSFIHSKMQDRFILTILKRWNEIAFFCRFYQIRITDLGKLNLVKLGYGGLVLVSSQFSVVLQLPRKMIDTLCRFPYFVIFTIL